MSLVTVVLTCGCQNTRQCPCSCTYPPTASAAIPYKPPTGASVMAGKSIREEGIPMSSRTDGPVMHTAAKPSLSAHDGASANPSTISTIESARGAARSLPTENSLSVGPNAEAAAQPHYSHDPQYHRLVGVLEYSRIQDAWTLRYASVEEADRYGGSVTLNGVGPMARVKNHQQVRVEGYLINPESQQIHPAFQVESLRVVQP
jgi:hypothetical protein